MYEAKQSRIGPGNASMNGWPQNHLQCPKRCQPAGFRPLDKAGFHDSLVWAGSQKPEREHWYTAI